MKYKVVLFVFALLALLSVGDTFASYVPLPQSNYYQGHTFYSFNEGGSNFRGRINFAVYDTNDPQNFSEDFQEFEPPGTGRYVYAYQILNDSGFDAVSLFSVLVGTAAVESIGSARDGEDLEAIEPSSAFFWPDEPGAEEAVFLFDVPILNGDDHSYFLMFRSDNPWKRGEYYISSGSIPAPNPNPEPATITLLGLGAAGAFSISRPAGKKKNF